MGAEAVGAGLPAGGSLSPDVAPVEGPEDASRLGAARLASHRLAHLARRMATGRPGHGPVPPELRGIVEAHRDYHPKADVGAIVRAYDSARHLHAGQLRRSGEPYIIHPLAVTEILAELGVDTTTIVAALLHDTVEDTGATLEELAEEFGTEVANLVDGVTKLDKMRFGEAAEAETLRKLIVALARDYRVLMIKIADRLHNMRTLEYMSPPKQAKISRVTLEVLAPLAHRLGVSVIKRELEDRAFAVLDPQAHRRTSELVDDFTAAERESGRLAAVVSRLRARLAEAKVAGEVSVRTSHLFSINRRAQERGRPPRDYYDIVRILVLVDDVTDCYAALGVIHGLWRPVPGRLRDFVATPKFNMYQSLHTTVTDRAGRTVDIQIRTASMHRLAETGIVARPVGEGADGARLEGLSWLHSLLDWQHDAEDPGEFLESLSSDLDSDEVLAFTPKGKAIALPARSSPVDVAYAVHTDVGHRAIGARVNGRLVPLHTRLRNGDVVEILTSSLPHAGPSEDWLEFVRTARARVRIRRRLARARRESPSDQPIVEPLVGQSAVPVAAAPLAQAPRPPATGCVAAADEPAVVPRSRSRTGPLPVSEAAAGPRPGGQLANGHRSAGRSSYGSAGPPPTGQPSNGRPAPGDAADGQEVLGPRSVARGPAAPPAGPPALDSAGTARSVPVVRSVGAAGSAAPPSALAVPSVPSVPSVLAVPSVPSVPSVLPVLPVPSGAGRRSAPARAGLAEVEGRVDVPVRIARCCLPLPGDEVTAFTTHHSAITLHRRECANALDCAASREPVRVISWSPASSHAFPTEIAVEAFDRYGLLADITEVLAETAAGLRAAITSTSDDGVAHARFTVEVTGPDQLADVLAAVRTVGGVYDCYRACQTAASP